MRLYHGKYIIPGLVAFLVVVTFPLWYGVVSGGPTFESLPNPEGLECIESRDYMRANHMRLLTDWRDEVVREGDRIYTAQNGAQHEKSLTKNCMSCHGEVDEDGESASPATYCLDCHDYVGVKTYCWDCHVDPVAVEEAK